MGKIVPDVWVEIYVMSSLVKNMIIFGMYKITTTPIPPPDSIVSKTVISTPFQLDGVLKWLNRKVFYLRC